MLTISRTARDVIRKIPGRLGGSTAGLRIAHSTETGPRLSVQPAVKPRSEDRALDYDGARVYLDAEAVDRLGDRMLDVRQDDPGHVQFVCTEKRAS